MAEPRTDQRFRLRELIPAAMLLIVLLSGLAFALLVPSGKTNQYAIVVTPWSSPRETLAIIQEAEGQLLSMNVSLATIITVYSDRKDFSEALYRAGLWLVFEPGQVEGCVGIQQRALSI